MSFCFSRGDPNAGIRHHEMQPQFSGRPGIYPDAQPHGATLCELDGVADEIDDDLP